MSTLAEIEQQLSKEEKPKEKRIVLGFASMYIYFIHLFYFVFIRNQVELQEAASF
jgi:hypothetical protein